MQVYRDAPVRFLGRAFLPDDWIAVLLKRYDGGEATQRVGPLSMVVDPRFQAWLRYKNAQRFNVFVSVNTFTPGRRSRTRDSVIAVRHLFLDADREADLVLDAIGQRSDLPAPSYVLRSSKGRAHVLWRVDGASIERAEVLQKQLARELGTDPVATSATQMTRLPGFLNHKYTPPQIVVAHSCPEPTTYRHDDFPVAPASVTTPTPAISHRGLRSSRLPLLERARRYLAATPPAIAGQNGDAHTFAVCRRLIRTFELDGGDILIALQEWNGRCEPPWSQGELALKIASIRRHAGRRRDR